MLSAVCENQYPDFFSLSRLDKNDYSSILVLLLLLKVEDISNHHDVQAQTKADLSCFLFSNQEHTSY